MNNSSENVFLSISQAELSALEKLRDEKAFFGPDGGLWTESGPLEVNVSAAIGGILSALKWYQKNRQELLKRTQEEETKTEQYKVTAEALLTCANGLRSDIVHKDKLIQALQELRDLYRSWSPNKREEDI